MNQLEPTGDYLDLQNDFALTAIIESKWDDALENLERNRAIRTSWTKWKGISQYILVEACERPECPASIIEYLITDGGPNMFTTRPCKNPGGIGAMTPICIAAEKGNITAIDVFLRANKYACNGYSWPATCAFHGNNGYIFDLLITENYKKQKNDDENFDFTYNFMWDFAVDRMILIAIEKNLDQSLSVIKKYVPNHHLYK